MSQNTDIGTTTPHRLPIFLLSIAMMLAVLALAANAQPAGDADVKEVVLELQQALNLSDQQVQQVGAAMAKFAKNMEATMAEFEASDEEKGADKLADIKQVRDAYREDMQGILTKDQYSAYLEMVTMVQREMMSDVAAIRLMDMQNELGLSDEQVEQLAPIVGSGMHDMISLLMENVDKRLSVPRKVRIGRSAKKIQGDMEKQIMPLLNPQQQQAYQASQEARKKR